VATVGKRKGFVAARKSRDSAGDNPLSRTAPTEAMREGGLDATSMSVVGRAGVGLQLKRSYRKYRTDTDTHTQTELRSSNGSCATGGEVCVFRGSGVQRNEEGSMAVLAIAG